MPKKATQTGSPSLAISRDGNRILLGQKVSEDADGNVYYHLYMDVGDSIRSIDLTPGVISAPGGSGFKEGVLFDGMTEDGSRVYFSTKDALSTASNQDTDESADIYRADVSEELRHPDPGLHRQRRKRQYRCLRTGLQFRRPPLERGRSRRKTVAPLRSAAVGEWPPNRARSTSSPPRSSVNRRLAAAYPAPAKNRPKPAQPLPLDPRLRTSLHRHP